MLLTNLIHQVFIQVHELPILVCDLVKFILDESQLGGRFCELLGESVVLGLGVGLLGEQFLEALGGVG